MSNFGIMKKTVAFLVLGTSVLMLTSCGGGKFQKFQTSEQMNTPFNCSGLHMRNAQWHFVDDFGQTVDAIGTCKKGMKHGNFKFSINGTVVAKTKYNKDIEIKSVCMLDPKNSVSFAFCMEQTAKSNIANIEPVDAEDDSDFLDEE